MLNQISATDDAITSRLAAPGAGLPAIELFFARILVKRGARRTSREASAQLFADETRTILEIVNASEPVRLSQRALIKRLQGLEDSSRYWSVLMTLDHLRIVNGQVASAIRSLAQGVVPARAASTASVKPDPEVEPGVIDAFQEGCAALTAEIASIPNLATSAKYAHPWFGPFDAAGWHFIAAFHMRLHRKQIELILSRLALDAAADK